MKREPSCNSTHGTHDSQRRHLALAQLPPRPCPACGWVLSAMRGVEPEEVKSEEEFMSLTRDEWEEMWWAIKRLEVQLPVYETQLLSVKVTTYNSDVKLIKEKIQQVIGQME